MRLIVTLTTWHKRIGNVPVVLDSIFAQTKQPDGVVLNLSLCDFPQGENSLPEQVRDYLHAHSVELLWHEENAKVYKKLLPTIGRYPNDLVLAIDDDFIYPETMIADFLAQHEAHPDDPISGNHFWWKGVKAHCGCASLVQAKHFEGWREYDNDWFRSKVAADDLFYTYLAAKNGYFYRQTDADYQSTAQPFHAVGSYSADLPAINKISSNNIFHIFGYKVVRHFIDADPSKPFCVLGAAITERGKLIEKELVEWLRPNFNLYVVRHNGRTFEYIALAFMRMMCLRLQKPFFYLHTKGAYNVRKCAHRVRNMWHYEFVENQKAYTSLINQNRAVVVCPYTGTGHVTWYNGWALSVKACEKMAFEKSDNRFFYEYDMFKNVEVVATRFDNISDDDSRIQIMHKDLIDNFD